jgi:NRPS condensation-like uncharacterized protein/acyl carrier protein
MDDNINMEGCYVFPASPGQERLWFLHHYDESLGAVYNMSTAFKIEAPLNRIALQKALNIIIQRHEVLRTSLVFSGGTLKQLIKPRLLKIINFVNCTDNSADTCDSLLQKKMRQEASRTFNMAEPGLLRLSLYQTRPCEYSLLLVVHHSVCDGVSLELLIDDLFGEYESSCNNEGGKNPPPEFQFADITEWNREWFDSTEYVEHAIYWKEKLKNAPLSINMPVQSMHESLEGINFNGQVKHFSFDAKKIKQVQEIVKTTKTTNYVILLSAFSLLVYYYSGQKDFLIGVPVANRSREETNQTIGFLANTVVIRITIDDGISVKQLVEQVHLSITEAVAYQRYPYRHLHELIQPKRHANNNSLFQIMFAFQDVPAEIFNVDEKPLERISVNTDFARFDISLFLFNENDTISGFFEYSTQLYSEEKIETIIGHYSNIFSSIARNVDIRADSIEFYSDSESQQTLQLLKTASRTGLINKQLDAPLKVRDVTITAQSSLLVITKAGKIVAPNMVGELVVDNHFSGINVRVSTQGDVELVSAPSSFVSNDGAAANDEFVASESDAEIDLEIQWKQLLESDEPISTSSSFFSLGGHSMLVAKMVDLIEEHFNVVVPMKDIFFNPTIAHLAKKINFIQQGFSQETNLSARLDIEEDEYMELMGDFI